MLALVLSHATGGGAGPGARAGADAPSFERALRELAAARATRTGDALSLGAVSQLMAGRGAQRAGEAAIHRAVLFKYLCDCVGVPCGIAADGDEAPTVYLRDEDALGADGHGGPRAGDVVVDLSRPPFEASVVRA